jgi:opacity protein-like surface antigen
MVCTPGVSLGQFTANQIRWGYMTGAGFEIGLFGGWSAKVEYNYLDFGSKVTGLTGSYSTLTGCIAAGTCVFPGTTVPAGNFVRNFANADTISTVTFGLNYRF